MISPKFLPEAIVILAAASCRIMVAKVEKANAQSKAIWKEAPALEAVVTVPGPMNAADIIDQKTILRKPLEKEITFAIIKLESERIEIFEVKVRNEDWNKK